jgi:phosphatidylcholine synthase
LVLNIVALVIFSSLVFVPIGYLYPSKNLTARRTTYALGGIWGVCVAVLLVQLPAPPRQLAWLSLFFPIYYFALSLRLHFRRGS